MSGQVPAAKIPCDEPAPYDASATPGGAKRPAIPTINAPDFSEPESARSIDKGVDCRKPLKDELFSVLKPDVRRARLIEVNTELAGGVPRKEYFHVGEDLAECVVHRVALYWVIPCYSLRSREHFIWLSSVNDTGWGRSVRQLLEQPPEVIATHAFRMDSDRRQSTYRFRLVPLQRTIPDLPLPIGELLAESLGADHLITNADHPVYRRLVEGKELR